MRLALHQVDGSVLTGEEDDVRGLLAYNSAFGVEQPAVEVERRLETAAGPSSENVRLRWVNQAHLLRISEVPDA